MAALLETPSRIWRRIEDIEGRDMPSLPSLPPFDDDSADDDSLSSSNILGKLKDAGDDESNKSIDMSLDISGPAHSTPAPSSHYASTIRATSSVSSTARFAHSIASRSAKSASLGLSGTACRTSMGRTSRGSIRRDEDEMSMDSFDASVITSLPVVDPATETDEGDMGTVETSKDGTQEESISVPEVYLPPEEPEEHGLSFADALATVNESREHTPKKFMEYSVNLRSEPKPSPRDRFRNVAIRERKTITTRTRTPSLSRTTPSPHSSPTNSTPRSNRTINMTLPRSATASPAAPSPVPGTSIPLPRSNTASPAIVVHYADDDLSESILSEQEPSLGDAGLALDELSMEMDVTEVHQSPFASTTPADLPREASTSTSPSRSESVHEQSYGQRTEDREPTFSSEEGATPPKIRNLSQATPRASPSPVAMSSPALSAAFTPTPAASRPRLRARFASDESAGEREPETPVHYAPEDAEEEVEEEGEKDPLTPHAARRRSFLLAVVNSTTRPRLKMPTPHPRRESIFPGTPSIAESTPVAAHLSTLDSNSAPSTGPRLQAAFAGVTPRPPPRRTSHPLAQGFTPESPPSAESREGSASPRPPSESGSAVSSNAQLAAIPPWATPGPSGSPYDGASDRASFISTASSHDLTTHHRANTSFDPVLGLGAQGHGLGRFNAGKLNTYLHSLNRRLQEENELLEERVRLLEEKAGQTALDAGGRRLSGGSRRSSLGGTMLGNVEEDVNAEGWMEEKVQLEEMMEDLQTKLDKCLEEKDNTERALEEERTERSRDKERWKERMAEVETGVEGIVRDLERRVHDAEKDAAEAEVDWQKRVKDTERKWIEAEEERDAALERVAQAERALESGQELGGELASANERIAQLAGDVRSANIQIGDLEDELGRVDEKLVKAEKELHDEKELAAALEEELMQKEEVFSTNTKALEQKELEIHQLQQELNESKNYVSQLEEEAGAATERIESLEEQISALGIGQRDLEKALNEAHEDIEALQDEVQRANELARQMEEALEAAEEKMHSDEHELVELQAKVDTLVREREREASFAQKEPSKSYAIPPIDIDVEALEAELDDAHKEIAKLTTLLNQSPARKAVEKARETKIDILEKENEELKERVKALRSTVTDMSTPGRVVNASGMSPFHRQVLAMSMRAPRTPGAPLKDMSWLNNSPTVPDVAPFVSEISRLQKELDLANQSIDDKLDKLEDVGFDVVGLTKKLEDARSRITSLEDEIARLLRREERRNHRLERIRCKKCLLKVDFHAIQGADESSYLEESHSDLPSEPPTPPTKTTEALRAKLKSVNDNLAGMHKHWEEEKSQLLGEKAMLQDTTNRLNLQLQTAKEETKRVSQSGKVKDRVQADVQQELDNARQVIAGLESELRSERAQLRVLGTEQSRLQREREDVLGQLRRTESDVNDVKAQLQRVRKENHELETELRSNDNADQKARILEGKLLETAETIEQLRQERSLLAADHKQLQRKYAEISEQASHLRGEYTAFQATHDKRRQQLDLRQTELDELRQALTEQADELRKAEAEKNRMAVEKKDVARTISVLEGDLKRVRKEAEALGRDLKLLRADKERLEAKRKEDVTKAERAQKQSQSQIRILNEQIQTQKDKFLRVQNQMKTHVCAADDRKLEDMRIQHKDECKGLLVNIRYLQAKLTREGMFRLDLGHQKRYLLVLLAQFEKSEQTIIAAIAKIGYPLPPPPSSRTKKLPRLKSVALCVMFFTRAKMASSRWKEHTTAKAAVVSALQEVRRRRAIPVS
ncbi:Pericentrin/AKAP-450 centrosomal targeting domain-containing protein [Pleurotus pulmonarius]